MRGFTIFDGAMGTMLQARGLKAGAFPETYNLTHPDVVLSIHKAYVEAGADVVTANTFGANPYKMKGLDVELLDHLVFADGAYTSMLQSGMLRQRYTTAQKEF